jgi:hypothetical protein
MWVNQMLIRELVDQGRDILIDIFFWIGGLGINLGYDLLTILEIERVLLAFFLKSCEMSPYLLGFFI